MGAVRLKDIPLHSPQRICLPNDSGMPVRTLLPAAKWRRPESLTCRQYCEDEPDWAAAVELLSQDEGAGWALLQDLATGGRSAAELAASRFCEL